jgi:hypothetical protein
VTEQRARVEEWRITKRMGPYVVRWWIEADPEHGGLDHDAAEDAVITAEASVGRHSMSQSILARHLIDAVPSANSVEVCYPYGNGVAVHRDWP